MTLKMVSFFRRKKADGDAASTDSPAHSRYSIEELAAAFPAPPAPAVPEAPTTPPDVVTAAAAPAAAPAAPVQPAPTATIADIEPSAPEAPPAAPGRKGWRDRLRGTGFARSFGGLFSRNPKLDEDLLAMLVPVAIPLKIDTGAKPFVLLTVGVNGVGKTTTIGKLARRFRDQDRSLMLAAGDTFRAAAVAQLQAWGERNGVPVVAQGQNSTGKGGDAASVAFDALQAAKARGIEVLLADTAGRLHTQQGLMAELGKIKRVLQK